jgi:membrane-associated protease RseP (regulator of RpoE activity)
MVHLNLALAGLNLMPAPQLDGGRAVLALGSL